MTKRMRPFKVGQLVRVHGDVTRLIGPMQGYPGGWDVDPPVQGLPHWNEDEMIHYRRRTGDIMCMVCHGPLDQRSKLHRPFKRFCYDCYLKAVK